MKTFEEAKKYFIDETNTLSKCFEDINTKINQYKQNLENLQTVLSDEFREKLGEDPEVINSIDLLVKEVEKLETKFD